jgi:hypothetical protein
MDLGQRAATVKFLIRDRAGQFTSSFDAVFTVEGVRILASPPQAPRANAICERVIGTLRREVLDRLLIVNERHLRQVLTEYLQHYDTTQHRHRSLGQLTPAQAGSRPPDPVNLAEHRIGRKQVLGGLTHEYYIAALPPNAATGTQVTAQILFPGPTGSARPRLPGRPSRAGAADWSVVARRPRAAAQAVLRPWMPMNGQAGPASRRAGRK